VILNKDVISLSAATSEYLRFFYLTGRGIEEQEIFYEIRGNFFKFVKMVTDIISR